MHVRLFTDRRLRRLATSLVALALVTGCGSGGAAEQAEPTEAPPAPAPSDGSISPAPGDGADPSTVTAPSSPGTATSELPPELQPFTRIEGASPDDLVASGLLLGDYVPTYGEFGAVEGDGRFSVVQGTLPGELVATYGTCLDVSVAAGWEISDEYEFGDNMGFMARKGADELHYMLARSEAGGLDVRVELVLF